MKKRLEINITGKVQGVGFRSFVKKQAIKLNLFGYVSNKEDGLVQVIAEGEEKSLEKLKNILKQGNEYSSIKKIDSSFTSAGNNYDNFLIL